MPANPAEFWKDALTTESNQNTQAFFRGVNYRLNVFKALKAVYHSAVAYLSQAQAAAAGGATPLEALHIGESAFSAVESGIGAVCESIDPLDYVACVVLGKQDNGLTAKELEEDLRRFLADAVANQQKLPWYLRLSGNRLKAAADDLSGVDDFKDLLKKLTAGGWVRLDNGRYVVTPRNFEWGFKQT